MICKVLNYTFQYTSKVSENIRSKIRTGLYFALFFVALLYAASILDGVHLLLKCVIGAGLMGLIILFTPNAPVKRVKWNKPIAIMWFGMGLLQLASGILVSIEYLPMAMIWLAGYPMLFFVWHNRGDYTVLFREVAVAGNACFLVLAVLSIGFYPMNVVQYGGFVNNPNGIGQWVTFAFPLIVFLYYHDSGAVQKRLYCVELAMLFLLCFASKGRTAILAVGLMLLLLLVLRLAARKNDFLYYAKRMGRFVLCVVLVWAVCLGINLLPGTIGQNGMQSETLSPEASASVEATRESQHGAATPSHTTQATAPAQETAPGSVEKKPSGISVMITNFVSRMLGLDKAGTSLEDYSSGRLGIWIGALESMNWLGHPSREHIITYRNGDVGSNVHNVILQWCYDNGLIAGLLFTIMMVWAGIMLLKRSMRGDNLSGVNSYMLLVHAGFVCTGLFASVNLPFLYLIGFLYYMSFVVLFDGENQ